METYKKILVLLGFIQLVHLLQVASDNAMQAHEAKNAVIVKNIAAMKNFNAELK